MVPFTRQRVAQVSMTSLHDKQECLVLCRRFLNAPTEGDHWVVTVSHYILMKFFYFDAVLGDVIFSFNKRKQIFILLQFYMKNCIRYLFYDLDNVPFTYELYD
jgi:hypothetical protein